MGNFYCTSCDLDFEDSAPEHAVDWKPRCPRCLRVSGVEARVISEPRTLRKRPRAARLWLLLVSATLVVAMIVAVATAETADRARAVAAIAAVAIAAATLLCLGVWASWRFSRTGGRAPKRKRPEAP